ncbi:MAG TPA: hypothetical protein VGE23_00385 [Candidatus Paceibacterota bacterium]
MRTLKCVAFAAIALAGASALSACASATGVLYSEDRLAQITARHLGVDPSSIRIYDREPTGMGTYYNVALPNGQTTRCFHDGNLLGYGVFSNPPRCGSQINTNPMPGS